MACVFADYLFAVKYGVRNRGDQSLTATNNPDSSKISSRPAILPKLWDFFVADPALVIKKDGTAQLPQ